LRSILPRATRRVRHQSMDKTHVKAAAEAVLFASEQPINIKSLASILEISEKEAKWVLEEIKAFYENREAGVQLSQLADGYLFTTKEAYAAYIEKSLNESRSASLSYAALETLSVIAYKQPVTRNEIERIRGVNVDRTVATLLERQLIKEASRMDAPGRPILYGTTQHFLVYFGLNCLEDLPDLPKDAEVMIEEEEEEKENGE